MNAANEIDLLRSEAHIWLTAPATPESASEYLPLLAPEEVAQYERFKVERARLLYVAARALARSALSLYAPSVAPGEWRFDFNKHGRPEICEPTGLPPLRFNLSHTDGLSPAWSPSSSTRGSTSSASIDG